MKLRMKRLMVSILAVSLMLSNVCFASVASNNAVISLSSEVIEAGESVDLKVSIENNPGLAAFMLYLYYDTSMFSIDEEGGVAAQGKFNSSGTAVVSANEDCIAILWFHGSGKNVTADGDVFNITLKASDEAVNGSYDLRLEYEPDNTFNSNEEPINLNTVSGMITVSGGTDQSIAPEVEPVTFSDVNGHWAEKEILKAADLGLVNGYPGGTYGPDDTMTRAMCVTILWRAAGSPEPNGSASFTDLKSDWYKKAVAWAEENSVVNGIGNGKFDPDGAVTREQLATILHRMAGTPVGMEMLLASSYDASFSDSSIVSSWAKNAVYWAIYKEIYCGEDSLQPGADLSPKAYANRAQIAVMMVRYLDKY